MTLACGLAVVVVVGVFLVVVLGAEEEDMEVDPVEEVDKALVRDFFRVAVVFVDFVALVEGLTMVDEDGVGSSCGAIGSVIVVELMEWD